MSDVEGLREDLVIHKAIAVSQARMINKLKEQSKEMLEALKEIYKDCTKNNTEKMRVLIQKVEGE